VGVGLAADWVTVGVAVVFAVALPLADIVPAALKAIVGSDAATVRGFANAYLSPTDLSPNVSADRVAALQTDLAALDARADYLRVELRLPDGTLLFSSAGLAGRIAPASVDVQAALDGRVTAAIGPAGDSEALDVLPLGGDVLREYFPLKVGDDVVAVVGVWRDAAPILGQLDDVRRQVILVTLSAALLAAILLFFVFRSAQARISRGAALLLEAGRRDDPVRRARDPRANEQRPPPGPRRAEQASASPAHQGSCRPCATIRRCAARLPSAGTRC